MTRSAAALLRDLPLGIVALNAPSLGVLERRSIAACPPSEREALTETLRRRSTAHARAAHAQRHGASLETWLEGQHEQAEAIGCIAWVGHYGPPVRFLGDGAVRVVGKGPADYVGQLVGGRALVVEAKSVESLLYIDPPRKGTDRQTIPPHQAEHLTRCAEGGGLALLVVEHRGSGQIAAVPWQEVPWRTRASARRSIGATDVERWAVDGGELYLARWV